MIFAIRFGISLGVVAVAIYIGKRWDRSERDVLEWENASLREANQTLTKENAEVAAYAKEKAQQNAKLRHDLLTQKLQARRDSN